MKLEAFEKLTDAELRRSAIQCFEDADSTEQLVGTILFRKARFYLDEIERRQNDKISRRDFRMELIVILLIDLELVTAVGLAVSGENQQDQEAKTQLAALEQVQGVLTNLQSSSKATADTLLQLKGVTDTMNEAVQKQVEFYYDIQLAPVYDSAGRRLQIVNEGRSAVTIWDARLGSVTTPLPPTPAIIAPNGGTVYATLKDIYDDSTLRVPKGSTLASPYSLYIQNEKRQKFTVHCTLTALWQSDALTFHILTNSISRGWDLQKGVKKTP